MRAIQHSCSVAQSQVRAVTRRRGPPVRSARGPRHCYPAHKETRDLVALASLDGAFVDISSFPIV